MRLQLIFLLLFFSSTIAFSQKKGNKGLIDAKYECTYSVKYINDTIKMTHGTDDWFVLQIGDDLSYGYSYLKYQTDSLFDSGGVGTWVENVQKNIKNGTMSTLYSSDLMYAKVFKEYKEKKLEVIDHISINYFIYGEDLTPQAWTLLDDTMTIAGYACQKAVCGYKGRSYEAWFTPEIPINEGPWKFYGLPGLIIKLYDTKRQYEFELVGFKNTDKKIDIRPLTTKRITGFFKFSLTQIDRIKFLQAKFGEKGELITSADMAKVGLSNDEPVKQYYDYIELDYK